MMDVRHEADDFMSILARMKLADRAFTAGEMISAELNGSATVTPWQQSPPQSALPAGHQAVAEEQFNLAVASALLVVGRDDHANAASCSSSATTTSQDRPPAAAATSSLLDIDANVLLHHLLWNPACPLSAADLARLECAAFFFRRPMGLLPNRRASAASLAAMRRCHVDMLPHVPTRMLEAAVVARFGASWLRLLRFLEAVERAHEGAHPRVRRLLPAATAAMPTAADIIIVERQQRRAGRKGREKSTDEPLRFSFVHAGESCTFGIMLDGTVLCIGALERPSENSPSSISTLLARCSESRGQQQHSAGDAEDAPNGAPSLRRFQLPSRVVQVAGGHSFSVFLCEDGMVYSMGQDKAGECGHGSSGGRFEAPTIIEGLKGVFCTQVAVGRNHQLVLDIKGKVHSCGANLHGQLGHGDRVDRNMPSVIQSLNEHGPIMHVAAGSCHSLAVSAGGHVLAFGHGANGQLGLFDSFAEMREGMDNFSVLEPRVIENVARWGRNTSEESMFIKVYAAGDCSAALDLHGEVFTWGHGYCGSLGHGTENVQLIPKNVFREDGEAAIQLCMRKRKTLILDLNGKAYACGWNSYGCLGGGDKKILRPERFQLFGSSPITQVSVGSYHMVAIDKYGYPEGKGDNEYGQLNFNRIYS